MLRARPAMGALCRQSDVLQRAAFRLAAWQAALTLAVAAVAGLAGDPGAVKSALLGGGIGIVAGLYQALRMFRVDAAVDPDAFYRGVWLSEMVKIVLTVALFTLAIKTLSPRFVPMIGAYAATFIVYWVALGTGFPWPPGDGKTRK